MKHSNHTLLTADKNRNILPELQDKESLRIRRKLAAEWNSRRTQKQKDADEFYTADDITHATIADIIRLAPPKNSAPAHALYRPSRRISNPGSMTAISLVCSQTGIVSNLEIPRIPGFYMEYENPLSSVDNCRAIAHKGLAYLRQLDTQILAGILLILADDYGLFRFGPFETGATKNALLRSAGKESLIHAILYVENHIHSENYHTIPRLSFTIDASTRQNDIEARIGNWLKLVDKELTEPTIVFSPAPIVSTAKKISIQRQEAAKAEKSARKSILTAKKQLAEAVDNVKALFKEGIFTKQRRDFLVSVLDYNVFQTLTESIKAGIVLKLAAMETESRITALIKLFERDTVADIDSLMDDVTLTPKEEKQAQTVKLKTAFELQNSEEVRKAEWAKHIAQKRFNAFVRTMRNPVPYNAQCLLGYDKGAAIAHVTIDSHWPALPGLDSHPDAESIREAFARVHSYVPQDKPAVPDSVSQNIPSEDIVDMIDIGNGHKVPALLWNSMSMLKQTVYRRKLMQGS